MRTSTLLLLLGTCVAHQASAGPKSAIDLPSAERSPWSVGFGYAPVFGLKADFSGLGGATSPFSPQPLGGGRDYEYDNGYVRVDSSGNAGGQTWNWGYADVSQYDSSGGGSIAMNQTSSLANGLVERHDEAELGFEIHARYEAGTFSLPGTEAHWGFRGGFHYANVGIDNRDALTSGLRVLTDRFDLNGMVPPLAPYSGTFGGPGPLVSDAPTRSFADVGNALVTGTRTLDVHLVTLTLGPWLEIPVAPSLGVTVEAGLTAAVASGRYSFVSNTTITGLGTQTSAGRDSETDLLLGAHLGLGLTYQVDPAWSAFLTGRYQFLPDFDLTANGSGASLDFGSAFLLSVGVIHSF